MYTSFYGLNEVPFSISPNPKFFYLSSHHREALEQLKRGITQSGGFVLFTGEVGTGKTVIARSLINDLPNNVNKAVIYDPDLSIIEMLETICREFSIQFEKNSTKRVLIEKFNKYLTDNYKKGRKAILVIDEAQHLSDEVIEQVRLLTNIETDNEKLLQVILIGQPELQDILRQQHMRQIAQRITSRFHLLPLSLNEVDSYVRFRLQAAGCLQIIFSQGAIAELYKASGGIPRVINVIADRAMQISYQDKSHTVEKQHMQRAVLETQGKKAKESILSSFNLSGFNLAGSLVYVVWILVFAALGIALGFITQSSYPTLTKSQIIAKLKQDPELVPLINEYKFLSEKSKTLDAKNRESQRFLSAVSNRAFEVDGFKDLMSVWGFSSKYTTDDADIDLQCQLIRSKGFMCAQERGSLSILENYNVPAVIKVFDESQQYFYPTLLHINNNFAVLLMQGREWIVTREWLENAMEGEFRIIWPLPYGYDSINSQSPIEVQEALAQMLNNFDKDDGYIFNGWDNVLVKKIKHFQDVSKLKVDGMVGSETLWSLLPYTHTEHPLYVQYILPPIEEEAFEKRQALKEQRNKSVISDSNELSVSSIPSEKEELTLNDILLDNETETDTEADTEKSDEINEIDESEFENTQEIEKLDSNDEIK